MSEHKYTVVLVLFLSAGLWAQDKPVFTPFKIRPNREPADTTNPQGPVGEISTPESIPDLKPDPARHHFGMLFGSVPLINRPVDERGRVQGVGADWMIEFRGGIDQRHEFTATVIYMGNDRGKFEDYNISYNSVGLSLGARRTIHRERLTWSHGLSAAYFSDRVFQYVGEADTSKAVQACNGFGLMATAGTEFRATTSFTIPLEFVFFIGLARKPALGLGVLIGPSYGWGKLFKRKRPEAKHWWDDFEWL